MFTKKCLLVIENIPRKKHTMLMHKTNVTIAEII